MIKLTITGSLVAPTLLQLCVVPPSPRPPNTGWYVIVTGATVVPAGVTPGEAAVAEVRDGETVV